MLAALRDDDLACDVIIETLPLAAKQGKDLLQMSIGVIGSKRINELRAELRKKDPEAFGKAFALQCPSIRSNFNERLNLIEGKESKCLFLKGFISQITTEESKLLDSIKQESTSRKQSLLAYASLRLLEDLKVEKTAAEELLAELTSPGITPTSPAAAES
jgi:hypothetical protein